MNVAFEKLGLTAINYGKTRELRTGKRGEIDVTADDDNYQCKMVELLFTKILGKDAAKSFQITGSAAQHLRCISKNI